MAHEGEEQRAEPAQVQEDVKAWMRERDEGAARRLMTEFYPLVMSIVRTRLPRRSSEEDLAQEVFVRFFERLDQYDGRAPVRHWISRLAVNLCLDHLRAEKRRPELRWADLSEAQAEALERNLAAADDPGQDTTALAEVAARLLDTLAPGDRLVVQMLDLEGRTSREVAMLTGWNPVAIRVRAYRARRKLRKQLARLEGRRT